MTGAGAQLPALAVRTEPTREQAVTVGVGVAVRVPSVTKLRHALSPSVARFASMATTCHSQLPSGITAVRAQA